MRRYQLELIKYTMLGVNLLTCFFVSMTVYMTTYRICTDFQARIFLQGIDAIPHDPTMLVQQVLALLLALLLSLWVRDQFGQSHPTVVPVTAALDLIISFGIITILNFNYNGLILWVFTSALLYLKSTRAQYLLFALAVFAFLGTDAKLLSLNVPLFSINDYFAYYGASTQRTLMLFFNALVSINLVLFFIYCAFVIQQQQGTIDEVNQLYSRLAAANMELQQANEDLHEYAILQEKMGETKERNRLAREIHDTLGHTLTGLSAGLDACLTMIDYSKEDTKKQLEQLGDVTRMGLEDIRQSVKQLRPDALERFNLEHALKEMVARVNTTTSTVIDFTYQVGSTEFDEDEEQAIYRLVQESITNAIRHGQATHIDLHILMEERTLNVTISDDGMGCLYFQKGFGTTHMQERIEKLNGQISFDGHKGFTVKAEIPIRTKSEG
ncbi:MAG: sensor histidine kinase [Candidatus Limiplasma sp.]|nr:sensor histidine kinase [Candidatus Limiplasma sp.]